VTAADADTWQLTGPFKVVVNRLGKDLFPLVAPDIVVLTAYLDLMLS
jgi:hypothetical protein